MKIIRKTDIVTLELTILEFSHLASIVNMARVYFNDLDPAAAMSEDLTFKIVEKFDDSLVEAIQNRVAQKDEEGR